MGLSQVLQVFVENESVLGHRAGQGVDVAASCSCSCLRHPKLAGFQHNSSRDLARQGYWHVRSLALPACEAVHKKGWKRCGTCHRVGAKYGRVPALVKTAQLKRRPAPKMTCSFV